MTQPSSHIAMVVTELRAEMARQRKSQADAANLLGIAAPGISRRFSGATPLPLDEYLTLCAWLAVDPGEFLSAALDRATAPRRVTA